MNSDKQHRTWLTLDEIKKDFVVFKASVHHGTGRRIYIKHLRKSRDTAQTVYISYSCNGKQFTKPTKLKTPPRLNLKALYVGPER